MQKQIVKKFLCVLLCAALLRAAGTSRRYKIVDLLQSAPSGGDCGRPYLFFRVVCTVRSYWIQTQIAASAAATTGDRTICSRCVFLL